jgi:hypothetical protein
MFCLTYFVLPDFCLRFFGTLVLFRDQKRDVVIIIRLDTLLLFEVSYRHLLRKVGHKLVPLASKVWIKHGLSPMPNKLSCY